MFVLSIQALFRISIYLIIAVLVQSFFFAATPIALCVFTRFGELCFSVFPPLIFRPSPLPSPRAVLYNPPISTFCPSLSIHPACNSLHSRLIRSTPFTESTGLVARAPLPAALPPLGSSFFINLHILLDDGKVARK